jgi:hypothetical protein
MKSLTVDEILRGVGPGPTQSVGQMSVIPLLGEDSDTFAPPEVEVGTTTYGSVHLRNDQGRPTLIPPGAGWVVAQKAQDHALGGGALLRAGETRQIDTAMCIQQGQGGLIGRAKHELLILPATLRRTALSVRHVKDFRKLWEGIQAFNKGYGIEQVGGHLEFFVRAFQKELDQFVAEFEVVPRQVGAIILVGGRVAGVERAPSAAFWRTVWGPLVRVCYGSLAIKVARQSKAQMVHDGGSAPNPPSTRVPLQLLAPSLAGLRDALSRARDLERALVDAKVRGVRATVLSEAGEPDDSLGALSLTTVGSPELSGQVVREGREVLYASLSAAA